MSDFCNQYVSSSRSALTPPIYAFPVLSLCGAPFQCGSRTLVLGRVPIDLTCNLYPTFESDCNQYTYWKHEYKSTLCWTPFQRGSRTLVWVLIDLQNICRTFESECNQYVNICKIYVGLFSLIAINILCIYICKIYICKMYVRLLSLIAINMLCIYISKIYVGLLQSICEHEEIQFVVSTFPLFLDWVYKIFLVSEVVKPYS